MYYNGTRGRTLEIMLHEREVADMTIQEMKRKKKELGYTNEMVSELSGVPLSTVQKVFAGATTCPRYETLMALEKLFKDKTQNEDTGYHYSDRISEPVTSYQVKKQGEYTLEDYYALPDERRVELIDGVIYDMGAPNVLHQIICTAIWRVLMEYIEKKKGSCLPLVSPVDVRLDCDDKTMVQPDVLIVCDRDKVTKGCVYGAPDFIVEIISPSTRKKDMYIKLAKYTEAGVREYWLVDPDKKKVLVYDLEHEECPAIYGFDSKVPIAIFDGECEVDFAEIYEYISFLY